MLTYHEKNQRLQGHMLAPFFEMPAQLVLTSDVGVFQLGFLGQSQSTGCWIHRYG